MNLEGVSRLRTKLRQPWSRGATIVVTALVAASVGFAVARSQQADERNPTPTPIAEESWLEESIWHLEPMEDTPLAQSLADALPANAPAETEVLAMRYPNGDWLQTELVAVSPGDYEVWVACEFVDRRLADLSDVSVAVSHGSEQPVAGDFNLQCGQAPVLTTHQISYDEHFTLMISAYAQNPAFDGDTVDVDGEQVDVSFLVAIYLVPR